MLSFILSSIQFDKSDGYVVFATAILVSFVFAIFRLLRTKGLSVDALQDLAALANSKGGLVILMVIMWFFTLLGTAAICIWVLIKGIDPQNAVLILVLNTFTSTAFGTVNGALFKTMTGDEIKRNGNGNGNGNGTSSPTPVTAPDKPADPPQPTV